MARLKYKDGNGWHDVLSQVNVMQVNGPTDYETLNNLPQVNSVTLIGNKTSNDLGLQDEITSDNKLSADLIESGTNNKVFTAANQVKLSNIEAGAQVNTVNSVNSKTGAVVLDASDVGALSSSTKYGATLGISGTSLSLKDQDGTVLNTVTTQDTGATSVEMHSGDTGNALTNLTYDSGTRKLTFEKNTTFASINQISNPNLLINGDFRVNQRGEATYNNTNAGNNKYTVDRWIHYVSNDYTLTQNTGSGITVVNSSDGNADFAQIIENGYNLLNGKIVTASVKSNGTVYSVKHTISTNTSNHIDFSGTDCSLYIECTSSNLVKVWFRVRAGKSVSIDYIKLEIGEVATPFSPRPYAEELALCQRYFLRLGSTVDKNIGLGYSNSAGSYIYVQVPTPTTMRSSFTLSITSLSCKFYAGASLITQSLLSLNGSLSEVNENICRVAFQLDGTVTASTLWEARLPANNYLSIDCEIY